MCASDNTSTAHRELLRTHFYSDTCPVLQSLVANAVAMRLKQDNKSAGPLLRMFFHDCFVRGCEASILLNSTAKNMTERDAAPNHTLREFEFINGVKILLEVICPGVVSCADIIALTAKEVVVQSGGPDWAVELGRRDGRVSTAFEAATHLPSSQASVQSLVDSFESNGLSIRDLVTLSGAHTIGRAHCFQAARRFYDFNSSNGIDPALEISYGRRLRALCPKPINPQAMVALDPLTPNVFDGKYYQDLLQKRGLFSSDAELAEDNRTKVFVREYVTDKQSFFVQFPMAMIKLGRLGVLGGSEGEIRERCDLVNTDVPGPSLNMGT